MVNWIDAHTHLDTEPLFSTKEQVLGRAEEAGINKILLVNSEATQESFRKTLDCLNVPSPVKRVLAFGVHPHEAKAYTQNLEQMLLETLDHPAVVAFGEIGLDFFYNYSPQEIQVSVFKHQLQLSLQRDLPVVIHCRDAYGSLSKILKAEGANWRGMIHCFTGDSEDALKLLELGFFISFSGIITFPKAKPIRDAARIVPLERILVETDAPFLAPVPHRGKTNEPAFVVETIKRLSEVKKVAIDDLSEQLQKNFHTLFNT